jgi:hypothetical protein
VEPSDMTLLRDTFPNSLIRQVQNDLKVSVRHLIKRHPGFYIEVSRLRHRPSPLIDPTVPQVVGSNTEIVIEGMMRSATSFAVVAFMQAQDRPVKVAHHLHAAAQVIAASSLSIPTLVILRNPEDIVLSRVTSHAPITFRQALREYLDFYLYIIPFRKSFVLGSFDCVVSNFGRIIARINEKFGTRFAEFCHTDENSKRCLDLVAQFERARGRTENTLACPNTERSSLKDWLRTNYCSPELADIRTQAENVYEVLRSSTE